MMMTPTLMSTGCEPRHKMVIRYSPGSRPVADSSHTCPSVAFRVGEGRVTAISRAPTPPGVCIVASHDTVPSIPAAKYDLT
jgi:hypothetical protein